MEYYRIDKASFKIIETGEGFLRAKITIAKPGVFNYFNADGSVSKEAKLPDDIFSSDVLITANGAPITDDHPKKNKIPVLVDSLNYKEFVRGTISNPIVEFNPQTNENELNAIATIYDSALIQNIKNKKQNEASIGFVHTIDNNSGFYNGIKYDIAQKNIKINHVALVSSGRAGESVKIHIDKKEKNIMSHKWIVEGNDASNLLTYRMLDGNTDIQVDGAIHGELMRARNDSKEKSKKIEILENENKDLRNGLEKIKIDMKDIPDKEKILTELEIANDKAAEWKKKFDELENKIPDMIERNSKEKFQLIEFAKSVDPNMRIDGLSNKEIKLQIIAKGLPFRSGINIESQADEIVEARYDAACELLREKAIKNNDKPKVGLSIDRNQLAEKRIAMTQVYQHTQEKLRGGK